MAGELLSTTDQSATSLEIAERMWHFLGQTCELDGTGLNISGILQSAGEAYGSMYEPNVLREAVAHIKEAGNDDLYLPISRARHMQTFVHAILGGPDTAATMLEPAQ